MDLITLITLYPFYAATSEVYAKNLTTCILTKNFLDFDILCFSESHLDANITTESLIMSSKYDIPYRKDGTNHGGGLLMYLSCELAHTRIIGLETFWNESLWVEIKLNRNIIL